MTEATCKNCRHWGDDASGVVGSHRMRFCNGLTTNIEPLSDDGSFVFAADSAMPEPISIADCGDAEPRFATGPDFGCVKFEPA